METFPHAFRDALTMVGLGSKRARAIKAHEDVRDVLARNETLKSWGVQTILIGSYGRETAIYPGKDVDVFVRLPDGPDDPEVVFQAVKKPLAEEYGDRLEEHRRSLMITFGDDFSVDVVPAIPTAEHWQIPEADENGERTRWEETDPEELTELTHRRNDHPIVDGDGAYVPTAKLIRQIRRHHLGKAKPGGFYFELEAYAAFEAGVSGGSRAEILASTLDRAQRLPERLNNARLSRVEIPMSALSPTARKVFKGRLAPGPDRESLLEPTRPGRITAEVPGTGALMTRSK